MASILITGVSAAKVALSGHSLFLSYSAVQSMQSYADATTGVPDPSGVNESRKQEEEKARKVQNDKNSRGKSVALLGGDPLGGVVQGDEVQQKLSGTVGGVTGAASDVMNAGAGAIAGPLAQLLGGEQVETLKATLMIAGGASFITLLSAIYFLIRLGTSSGITILVQAVVFTFGLAVSRQHITAFWGTKQNMPGAPAYNNAVACMKTVVALLRYLLLTAILEGLVGLYLAILG